MMFLSRAESSYLHQHLSVVRHVTLDPEGPGVLHIAPCFFVREQVNAQHTGALRVQGDMAHNA